NFENLTEVAAESTGERTAAVPNSNTQSPAPPANIPALPPANAGLPPANNLALPPANAGGLPPLPPSSGSGFPSALPPAPAAGLPPLGPR
ncbi:MAG: hypothetical protein DWH99_17335, partial [Planctomycetota bacterium]